MPAGAVPKPELVVVGSGLAGSLLALALARRGLAVRLIGPDRPGATGLSYGSLGRSDLGPWHALERCHGPLGSRACGLSIHGLPWLPPGLPPSLQARLSPPLPFARVDGAALAAALPGALAQCGVVRDPSLVKRIEAIPAGGWRLVCPAPSPPIEAAAVVLAAGVGCRSLWPPLQQRLLFSWAGVIAVDAAALAGAEPTSPWWHRARRGGIVRPWALRRPALEGSAAKLQAAAWAVDAGLAPRGAQILLGQITRVDPRFDPASAPDPARMEARLRQELMALDPELAALPGVYRQVAVPYCLDGQPLVGPIEGAPALWVFSGFRGAFTSVPPLAETLADTLAERIADPRA